MKLLLIRDTFTDISTTGKLFVDGKFECHTLEDAVRETKVFGKTAIPIGTYQIIIDMSNHFRTELPRLLNVPNYEGVRIHSGNKAEDTEGCILVGGSRKENWISNSKTAFIKLFDKLETAYHLKNPIEITIQ